MKKPAGVVAGDHCSVQGKLIPLSISDEPARKAPETIGLVVARSCS
jgi:hypothetical protein